MNNDRRYELVEQFLSAIQAGTGDTFMPDFQRKSRDFIKALSEGKLDDVDGYLQEFEEAQKTQGRSFPPAPAPGPDNATPAQSGAVNTAAAENIATRANNSGRVPVTRPTEGTPSADNVTLAQTGAVDVATAVPNIDPASGRSTRSSHGGRLPATRPTGGRPSEYTEVSEEDAPKAEDRVKVSNGEVTLPQETLMRIIDHGMNTSSIPQYNNPNYNPEGLPMEQMVMTPPEGTAPNLRGGVDQDLALVEGFMQKYPDIFDELVKDYKGTGAR